VDIICFAMGLANLLGYLKCANAARTLTTAATNYAVKCFEGNYLLFFFSTFLFRFNTRFLMRRKE
jgi:hypothetical protein